MIAVFGASGRLGRAVARLLIDDRRPVRAVTRNPASLADFAQLGVEVVVADLRDTASTARACAGATHVVAATHGFPGQRGNDPPAVDRDGNRRLVDAARGAGIERFVFVSAAIASADNPVDFFRFKQESENYLRDSGMEFTILRAAAFMEFWAAMIGDGILKDGKAKIFGVGENPINFVSVADVARYVVASLDDPRLRNRTITVGGPQDLSFLDVVATFERVTGRTAVVSHVPLAVMRAIAAVTRRINAPLWRQVQAGIQFDTTDQRCDMAATAREFGFPMTRLDDLVQQQLAAANRPVARG
ncbi:MAG: SDR family oxidoreductase [Betaproteobacteria bacterium]